MTGRPLQSEYQKRFAVLDRRTRLVWSDWLVRHAPEVLLGKAGLVELQVWYANQPVFMGKDSAHSWSRNLEVLRQSVAQVERYAAKMHAACPREKQVLAVPDRICIGPFAERAYRLGVGLVHPEVHYLSWKIAVTSAAAWWARNEWTIPADFQQTLTALNDPIRGVSMTTTNLTPRDRRS